MPLKDLKQFMTNGVPFLKKHWYLKVANRSTSCLVAPPRIFRLLIKLSFAIVYLLFTTLKLKSKFHLKPQTRFLNGIQTIPSLRDAGPPKRSVASFGVGVCMRRYRAVGNRDTGGTVC